MAAFPIVGESDQNSGTTLSFIVSKPKDLADKVDGDNKVEIDDENEDSADMGFEDKLFKNIESLVSSKDGSSSEGINNRFGQQNC